MRSIRLMAAVASLAIAATSVVSFQASAQSDNPIEKRQQLMKENGKAAKAAVQMIKGQAPYDPATAEKIFTSMHDVAMKFGDYFPPDSRTGHKTEAAPAIWDKPDQFKATLAKFQKDTAAAAAAKPQDLDSFKQQFGMVAKNCKSCHQDFRIEKD